MEEGIEPERENLPGNGTERESVDPGIAEDRDGRDPPQRHSSRHGAPPDRLHYTQLGNPLTSIVQSLFHGLSVAFTETLQNPSYADSYAPQSVVNRQPSRCNGTYTPLRGECVTPGYQTV